MPEMVYWNLAAGGTGPNPITVEDIGATLVSGYSQALLKVFMEGGGFVDPDADEEMVMVGEDGETTHKAHRTYDPLDRAKQAVGHKSYDVLEILD
jgi:hypothetical protein